jgi:hypothetical protein
MNILQKSRDHYLNYSHNDTAPNLGHTCCEWDISLDRVAYTDLCHHSLQPHSPSLLAVAMSTVECPHERPNKNINQLCYNVKIIQYKNTVKPLFIGFVGGLKKKQWIQENNRCGNHSWNRIRSGAIEIEWWIREIELSGNDRQMFRCILWKHRNFMKTGMTLHFNIIFRLYEYYVGLFMILDR